ncbi:helix-turn-helix domain-containing protein [Nannocystis bainbridge]|uniref:helix-turn-helix domain-containing protein n=1 Tax=Nannocystis bainbridge TaxID=2995303 RepID=UPI00358DD384
MDETSPPAPIQLDNLNLRAAERRLCELALKRAGSVVGAAALLGVTRHAMRRRMTKLRLAAPPSDRRARWSSARRGARSVYPGRPLVDGARGGPGRYLGRA